MSLQYRLKRASAQETPEAGEHQEQAAATVAEGDENVEGSLKEEDNSDEHEGASTDSEDEDDSPIDNANEVVTEPATIAFQLTVDSDWLFDIET